MKVIIADGTPKEIAALVLEIQERQIPEISNDELDKIHFSNGEMLLTRE